MKNSRKLLLAAVVVIIGVFLVFWNKNRFQTQKPRRGSLVESVYGVGTVTARKIFQIKTSVPGIVRNLPVKEGQAVKAGVVLMVLDDNATFKAPFEGTVTSLPFKLGELVIPQLPALTMMNLKDLFLEVSLEQQSALRILSGQNAVVTFESLRNERFQAKVDAVYPRDGQFVVRVELIKVPPNILPAMTADVSIEIIRKDNVLMIPVSAISGGRVLINRNSKRLKQQIQIGAVDGEWAEVLGENILEDDEILIRKK